MAAAELAAERGFRIANADVTLIAAEDTVPRAFRRAESDLRAALPPVFSLTAILPEVEAEDGTDDPDAPEFVATLSPEGLVQLPH